MKRYTILPPVRAPWQPLCPVCEALPKTLGEGYPPSPEATAWIGRAMGNLYQTTPGYNGCLACGRRWHTTWRRILWPIHLGWVRPRARHDGAFFSWWGWQLSGMDGAEQFRLGTTVRVGRLLVKFGPLLTPRSARAWPWQRVTA